MIYLEKGKQTEDYYNEKVREIEIFKYLFLKGWTDLRKTEVELEFRVGHIG